MSEDPEIAWRVDALRVRLPPDGSVPRELSILNLGPQAGRCPSCGEPQPYEQTGKCTRCCLAAVALLHDRNANPKDGVTPAPVADGVQ